MDKSGVTRLSRREFLKAVGAGVVAASIGSVASSFAAGEGTRGAGNERSGENVYYVEFEIDAERDRERYEYYKSLGLLIERDGKICVANPLLPDRCMTYVKPYEEDRFELLPPGADEDFYAKCVRCGLCYYACLYEGYYAIRLVGVEGGLERVGTPIVPDVMHYPCTLCMKCTIVCPTGALREVKPKEVRMGVAMIDPDLCWAWNSGECYSCAKACPFGTEVFEFTFNEWGVHTRVRPEKCTGCGQCVSACPVNGSAIHVLPREEYERRAKNFKNTGMSYEEYLELILRTERENPEKATFRAMIVNSDYIINIRGIVSEKVVETLETENEES
ncbi:putative nitrate reductase, subunit G [Pyrolobus fumarii 1A]|uniref:Putative nitrate reductase, subunit G n=1 Tax=Pyrolobus fumarii (strain DSM 11204 / 1A) TaxID=694429 RepID=G0EGG3_PYRF1|nr:4Fe-4S dicluster domain-containing protein [Pyrolobus fumarii]AEM39188.1 putative nitrate reductase, subunit G [Pyrolobus fumarii 1A]